MGRMWLNSRVLASEVMLRPQMLIGSSLFIYSDLPGIFFISFTWPLAM